MEPGAACRKSDSRTVLAVSGHSASAEHPEGDEERGGVWDCFGQEVEEGTEKESTRDPRRESRKYRIFQTTRRTRP